MTKNQKILFGAGAVAVVGYLLWKKQTSFAGKFNATGSKLATYGIGVIDAPSCTCNEKPSEYIILGFGGTAYRLYHCGQSWCDKVKSGINISNVPINWELTKALNHT